MRFLSTVLISAIVTTAAFAGTPVMHVVHDESTVTYRLVHPLHKIEASSKDVEYTLQADPGARTISSVSATVDVMTFNSGNSNRDSHAMEVIDALTYPDAEFSSTSVAQAGDSITVTGQLTFHGVTKPVVMKGVADWQANKVVVKGGFEVSLAAFNIERPSLLLIPVEDRLLFDIVATFTWS
jgi:polyisoprenoid-binding protein YceI